MKEPTNEGDIVRTLLDVLEHDVLPVTRAGVAAGNKIFGAAIIRKDNLGVVVASTNRETDNPLFHGEVSCLNDFWALPAQARPMPRECIFLSTHEPCSMCLSAITWSGFDNFTYFFSYEDSRDDFAIPHDLNILEQVFRCADGGYAARNDYWQSRWLLDDARAEHDAQIARIRAEYASLSQLYQQGKHDTHIPLA